MVLTSTLKVALENGPYIGAVPFLPHPDFRVFILRPRSWVRKVLVNFLECPGGGGNDRDSRRGSDLKCRLRPRLWAESPRPRRQTGLG